MNDELRKYELEIDEMKNYLQACLNRLDNEFDQHKSSLNKFEEYLNFKKRITRAIKENV
jgi:hypothetical protein